MFPLLKKSSFFAQTFIFPILSISNPQWGANAHGWVAFPVTFTRFRQIITNHQGQQFMQSRSVEYTTLTGYTLAVDNNETLQNDAQWIAIGI